MDVHSKKIRSYNMSKIKGKDTKPEIIIRKWLWNQGFRYRLHVKSLPGTPDITFLRQKKVIFINGCFWHKHNCGYFRWPETNREFWKQKITKTVERDEENYKLLEKTNWGKLIIWECELKNEESRNIIYSKILDFLLC